LSTLGVRWILALLSNVFVNIIFVNLDIIILSWIRLPKLLSKV